MECIFCRLDDYALENDLAYAVFDAMPVNEGHMLIIPKRHVQNYFDLKPEEEAAMLELLHKGKKLIEEKYSPDGYNFGVNCNSCAGQSVMHAHMHLIPRYRGDSEAPLGGVRGVIPEKMGYIVKK
ncbi:HIT family protein [Synergistes jonesii]|uniref:Diadenosine tetraphosphate hydrolase n=1 Tax=Synergistes jonesii TaxID=2754 RepID=A0A073IQD9_9BACT|nr:HIT family protein [Synergistes jonesii]KEJ92543.1 diadenosine tetraphosphate hydrolase [Synergistes jonesii]OFB61711.1 diadenosine tetraphosphate hydrolase [Synergistes jonesii]OFB63204.1 diadenosine tetraphosphate hydrolase [Synergistes jonesii]OFB64076.1 diadenosine tetraphosphate hydrolase [Synergistes jonesii]OFB67910.1 diadenosine tetraphosphate hydrolase [Synergistes jonesii]